MKKTIIYIGAGVVVVVVLLVGGFFVLNGYIYNAKQGDMKQTTAEPAKSYIDDGYTYFGNEATGDLDGDGTADSAFLLYKDGGGSGTFYYIGVAFNTPAGYLGTNAIFLGDRIAPQPTEIRDKTVIVNYADRKAGEPMTARPSVGVSKYFRVFNGILTPIEMPAMGGNNVVPSGWKIYSNQSLGFRMKYDPASKMQEDSQGVRWYQWGPTQSEGTEVYDGFILSFYKVNLPGTLNDYIEEQMKSFREMGGIDVPPHEVRINGTPAVSFTGSGLGTYTLTFISLEDKKVLVVSSMAPDPGNLGFQAKIDMMLSTFELIN